MGFGGAHHEHFLTGFRPTLAPCVLSAPWLPSSERVDSRWPGLKIDGQSFQAPDSGRSIKLPHLSRGVA